MKKTILFIILLIPFIINAKDITYAEAEQISKEYAKELSKDESNDYNRFFIDDSETRLISEAEYNKTKKTEDEQSYLYYGDNFWTKNKTIVGNEDSSTAGVRVTEKVKNNISATGNGTFSNPWVLQSDEVHITLYARTKCDNSKENPCIHFNNDVYPYKKYINKKDSLSLNYEIVKNETDTFVAGDTSGSYYIEPTECINGKIVSDSEEFTVSLKDENYPEDIICYIGIRYNKFDITYDAVEGYISDAKGGTFIEGGNKKVTRFQQYGLEYSKFEEYNEFPIAQRTGYTFVGWFTKDGVEVKATDKMTLPEAHTLYAHWEDQTKPTITCSKGNSGSTSGVTVQITCSDDGSGCSSSNTLSYSGVTGGNHTFTVKDNAGNVASCNVSVATDSCYAGQSCSSCCHTCTVTWPCGCSLGQAGVGCSTCRGSSTCCDTCCSDKYVTCYR